MADMSHASRAQADHGQERDRVTGNQTGNTYRTGKQDTGIIGLANRSALDRNGQKRAHEWERKIWMKGNSWG